MITDIEEYQADREAVKEYYANLLILQYRNKQKARKTIKLWVDLFLGDGLIFQLPDILDIDRATGACLDIIGKILGCSRIVQGITLNRSYFHFHKSPDTAPVGFSTVGNPQTGSMKSIANSNLSEYELDDDNYRLLLKIKAISNVLRCTEGDIDRALYSVFGNNAKLQNNKDMTIYYVIATDYEIAIEAAKKLGYFKAPCGVRLIDVYRVPLGTDVNSYVPEI